jgi:dephospho-CoA kinase
MSKYAIGLTGIIGSGKSLVADYFAELGIDIVDTDKIAHGLTVSDGAGISLISHEFGVDVLLEDGTLNRDKMRHLVFNNSQAKDKLENILHPLIYSQVVEQIKNSTSKYVILVVPLLFKSPKYLTLIVRSIFVDCASEDELGRRIKARSKLNIDTIQAIIKSQVSRETQLNLADDIIHNNVDTTCQELKLQVVKLHQYYTQIFN